MKYRFLIVVPVILCYLTGCNRALEHDHEHPATEQVHEQSDFVHLHPSSEAEPGYGTGDTAHTHEPGQLTHSHSEEEIGVVTLKRQEFRDILKTTGEIIPAREDVQVYHAQSGGFIHFANQNLVPGSEVVKGQVLFEIRGGILAENNPDLTFQEIRLEYEKEKQNYERAGVLVDEKIISEEEFLETRNRYENAGSRYRVYMDNRDQGGQKILAKAGGFVQAIYIDEGDYIRPGNRLATTIIRNRLVLRADVPQNHFNRLSTFTGATFTTPYSKKVYRSDALNGRLLAYGRTTDASSWFTPIFFEIDHHADLLAGSFVEINLLGKSIENALVVPKSALLEEQGKLYVFIRHEDGDFEKRYVTVGADDGEHVRILTGLEENQKVVVQGAYQVKLATMSTDLPDTHSH